MSNRQKQELIRFIDFYTRNNSSSVNSIQAIVSPENITSEIVGIFTFLNKNSSVLHYSKSTDVNLFLEELAWALYEGRVVLIVTDTLEFDPVLYDQLFQIRHNNKFTVNFQKDVLNRVTISPNAAIFLSYREPGESKDKKLFEIADHVMKTLDTN